MTAPAPHEPCCECFECQYCNAFPPYLSAVISGVQSTDDCQDCEDANEHYGLGKIPCGDHACGWYAFGHCQNLGHDSCGHVSLIELDIRWTIVLGQLIATLDLRVELAGGATRWEKDIIGLVNCNGPFTFTSSNLVGSGVGYCDFSQATIVLTGTDSNPC